VTFKLVLFTPPGALQHSFLLGLLASALASRQLLMSLLQRGATLSGPVAALVGVAVYLVAGLCEIGGGWLVWQSVRAGRPSWWAVCGSLLLVLYGFVATLQPQADFGRVFALYGAYFVLMSVAWGALLDGFRPDKGDLVGCALVLAGVAVMTAWPRAGSSAAVG
jgi:small multidrug resistance family-3 protein